MLIALGVFFELAAHADDTNEFTKITFGAPVLIPGQVLPAGTYIFQQAEPNDDLNVIQIFNADRATLYATLQTVPAERSEATGDTAITLAEPENGYPVLVKWFYPGRSTGHVKADYKATKPQSCEGAEYRDGSAQQNAEGQRPAFVERRKNQKDKEE